MSGRSLPRLLPRARVGYRALHPWKAALGQGRSFATVQDGPPGKKHDSNVKNAVGSSSETGPSSSTVTGGGLPRPPPSTAGPQGTKPTLPPKSSSGLGKLLGFALLGAAAGGGGFVWYTWEDGGPWGLWGPDVFVFAPAPGKDVETQGERKEKVELPVATVIVKDAPGVEEEVVVVGEASVKEGSKDEGEVGGDITAEGSGTEAAAVEEVASDDDKEGESVVEEEDDTFSAMEAARKASFSSGGLAPAPKRETEEKPAYALSEKNEEGTSSKVEESSSSSGSKLELATPEPDVTTKIEEPLDIAEDSVVAPQHSGLLADLSKDERVLSRLLEGVAYEARNAQLQEDEAKYKIKLEQERERHQHQLKEAHHKAVIHAQMLAKKEKELELQKRELEAALSAQHKRDEERRLRDLAKQNEEAAAALEEARLATLALAECKTADERAIRLADLRDIKIKLKALSTAFNARSEDAKKSYTTHKLAVGAFALEDAMSRGLPLSSSVNELRQSLAKDGEVDTLVDAALSSLPPNTLNSGTGTHTQLQQQLVDLEGAAKELALIPAGGSGVLAHALAKLVAKLKVSEKGTEIEGGGTDAVLARAQALLADGKLVEAATVLEHGFRGTQAESVVGGWSKAAHERAISEQALALIQAHAAAQAASLR